MAQLSRPGPDLTFLNGNRKVKDTVHTDSM